jgi:allantoin racemase
MSVTGLAQRRLLIVNPNSNPAVTAHIEASAQKVLGPYCQAEVVQAAGSPFAIQNPQDRAAAEPCVIALLRENPGYDAYAMACFDDIAIVAARRFIDVPIVDAVTASVTIARKHGPRFAIVTTVETMVPGIQTLLGTLGAADACKVLAADISVAEAAAGSADALQRLDRTISHARDSFGAETIILGSGGLTGHAASLSEIHGLPVIDCIEAAVRAAEKLVWKGSNSEKFEPNYSCGG